MKKIFTLFALVILFCQMGVAQQWTKYTAYNSGLGANDIYAIAIDNQGNKWFGTPLGVTRYDGTNWTKISAASGLAGNYTTCISVDKNGRIWVGSTNGLSMYDGVAWSKFTTADGLADNEISSIAVKSDGSVWIGTWRGISEYNGTGFTNFTDKQQITALAFDKSDNLWIGADNSLSEFNGTTYQNFSCNDPAVILGSKINAISVDNQGFLWVGTDLGVSFYNGTSWKTYTYDPNGLGDNMVHCIGIDQNGQKWFGTNNGLSKFDGQKWTTYNSMDGLSGNMVLSMAFEGTNNAWFGTFVNGVSRYVAPNLMAEPDSITINATSVTTSLFSVHSNVYWTATTDQPWLTIAKTAGYGNAYNIRVTATENTGTLTRDGYILVSSNGFPDQRIKVHQLASAPFVTIWNPTIYLSASANSEDFVAFTSNVPFTLKSTDNWLTISNEVFSGNVITMIRAQQNLSLSSRTSLVKIDVNGADFGTLTVVQDANVPALHLSDSVLKVPYTAGNSASFLINSTVDWTISSNQTWLTVDKPSGTLNSQVFTQMTENPDTTTRTAVLTISGTNLSPKTVQVVQAGQPYINVPASEIVISGNDEINTASFIVSSNAAWEARWQSNDWFRLSDNNNKLGTDSFRIFADKNPATNDRTGLIYIIQNGVWKTLTLRQTSGPYLNVSANTLNLPETGGLVTLNVSSNKNWTVWGTEGGFAGFDHLSGSNDGTITITAPANTGLQPKTMSFYIELDGENGIYQNVTIVQASPAPFISVSDSIIYLTKEMNATGHFYISANQSWSIVSRSSLYDVNPSSGSGNAEITVTSPNGNPFNSIQIDTVIVYTSDVQGHAVWVRNVILQQESANLFLSVQQDTLVIDPEGQQQSVIRINSNTDWDLNASSNVTLSKNFGSGADSVNISLPSNYTTSPVFDSVLVYSTRADVSRHYVYLKQGIQKFFVADSVLNFGPLPDTLRIAVSSNVHWYIMQNGGDQSWYSINKTTGYLNDTLIISSLKNDYCCQKDAQIIIYSKWGPSYRIVNLTQEPAIFDASPSYFMPYCNLLSTQKIVITANSAWQIQNSENWIQCDKLSGSGSDTVTVTVQPLSNPAEDRTGSLTLSLKDFTKSVTINVYQLTVNSGLNNSSKDAVEIYPNPATDRLFISGILPSSVIKIFDVEGKLQKIISGSAINSMVDINDLARGIYIIHIANREITYIKRVIKK